MGRNLQYSYIVRRDILNIQNSELFFFSNTQLLVIEAGQSVTTSTDKSGTTHQTAGKKFTWKYNKYYLWVRSTSLNKHMKAF